MAILLNMGGSCSVCVPLYITKRSEAVLQWGKRKNIKKMMIHVASMDVEAIAVIKKNNKK